MLSRIEQALTCRIALLVAPAGFGKTVAIRRILASRPHGRLYRVASGTNGLAAFVRGLVGAVVDDVPSLATSLSSALIDALDAREPASTHLARWFSSHVAHLDLTVAIDDLHDAGDPFEITRFIAAVIARCPAGPRWLIALRSTEGLPVAAWLASGEANLIVDAIDLRFDIDEAWAAAQAAHSTIDVPALRRVLRFTNGWPIAVAVAVHAPSFASVVLSIPSATLDVHQSCAEHVWHGLKDRDRDLLRSTVFFPRFSASLLHAAGFANAAERIADLWTKIPWFDRWGGDEAKLDDVFRAFIRCRIEADGPGSVARRKHQAADALAFGGCMPEALDLYVESAAFTETAGILRKHGSSLLDCGHADAVERAVTLISQGPESCESVQIAGLRARLAEMRGDHERADRLYRSAVSPSDGSAAPIELVMHYGRFSRLRDAAHGTEVVEASLERARRDGLLDDPAAAGLLSILASLYSVVGNERRAKHAMDEARRVAPCCGPELRADILARAADVSFRSGRADACDVAVDAVNHALSAGSYANASRAARTLTALHADQGRFREAMVWATRGVTYSEKAGSGDLRRDHVRSLAEFAIHLGDEDLARPSVAEFGLVNPAGRQELRLSVARSIMLAWVGNIKEAREALGDCVPAARSELAIDAALEALFAASMSESPRALAAARAFERSADEMHAWGDGTGTGIKHDARLYGHFIAVAYAVLRMPKAAFGALERLYHPAEIWRSYAAVVEAELDADPRKLGVALTCLASAGLRGHARLLKALVLERAATCLPGTLTAAELGVLNGLHAGQPNKAIALDYGVSVNTVKTHVASIMKKLAAASRGEAVAIARRRGVLPQESAREGAPHSF